MGLPFPGLLGLDGHALLVTLAGGANQAAKGLLLQPEGLGMLGDGLGRALQFLDGISELLVTQDTSCGKVGRDGEPGGQTTFLEGDVSDWRGLE